MDDSSRLDATQLEGCHFNAVGCCQGRVPTGPDELVTTPSLFFIVPCFNCGEVWSRDFGTNSFSTPSRGGGITTEYKSKCCAYEHGGCGPLCVVPFPIPMACTCKDCSIQRRAEDACLPVLPSAAALGSL